MKKEEDDFETLRDYNDYLEQVEEITWNLILNTDVLETEERLRKWGEHEKAERNPNAVRRDIEPPVSTDHVVLKKGATQRKNATLADVSQSKAAKMTEDVGFSFRGLKKRVAPPPEAPFDPYSGWSITPQYYILQDDYEVDWLTKQKDDVTHIVGGYHMQDFYDRSLRDAFGGLGVFIEDEINARDVPSGDAVIGTEYAVAVAAGGRDVNMDDVF
jgi:CDK-activating kinase assembly factor MAT1